MVLIIQVMITYNLGKSNKDYYVVLIIQVMITYNLRK